MHQTRLSIALLSSVLLSVPVMAEAQTDCGDQPGSTAEAVYTIDTPEQAIALKIETIEPVQIEAQLSNPNPNPNPEPIMPQPTNIETSSQTVEAAAPNVKAAVANYEAILQRRITRGEAGLNLFDYAAAKSAGELKDVKAYTDHLAAQNPDEMSEADQIAYWANLYNALTVKLILENYPVKSIRKIKAGAFSQGPWKRDEVTVNGKVLSLDDIEHGILRKQYSNPAMVHYMVNCASIGCPNLPSKLWVGETLDVDRTAAAREFINSPRGVAIKGDDLKVSSIYDWFKEDFGGSKSTTLDHYRKFAGPALKAALDAGATIDDYDYNWDLNE